MSAANSADFRDVGAYQKTNNGPPAMGRLSRHQVQRADRLRAFDLPGRVDRRPAVPTRWPIRSTSDSFSIATANTYITRRKPTTDFPVTDNAAQQTKDYVDYEMALQRRRREARPSGTSVYLHLFRRGGINTSAADIPSR